MYAIIRRAFEHSDGEIYPEVDMSSGKKIIHCFEVGKTAFRYETEVVGIRMIENIEFHPEQPTPRKGEAMLIYKANEYVYSGD